ncbi:MAG: ABC transporter ATP-binding protein/permease [Ruminococcus sp.]|nr:ABC transporter ATP-binding protein/permease [Ruminococcus sp.]
MLELKSIKKDYPAGDGIVHALKGIDLQFRKSEFVSILGPSGCGKTTMLNIIGGLDHYTEGDLIINGKSTKEFKDRDWDAYRNHSIGFVFQSYNLIPHQTVLQNVELALTLSGVSKSERRERAKKALEDVGLESQLNKKPTEMSGGQMQRVAIARALVNNPDIILADEPTGALDTETSVQVMEILKNIAKDRLIIMVTHNPELAEKYSTRIIRMLDGEVTGDTAPLEEKELKKARDEDKKRAEKEGKVKKPSMSFGTSFGLSLKNLFTKKGRTTLTSFAGSIGIIGIALIFAVSQGTTNYIDTVQEDTLSSYPLSIEASSTDISSIMNAFMSSAESDSVHENDAVYTKSAIYDMINAMSNLETIDNDLVSFKQYLEEQLSSDEETELTEALNGIQYTYDNDLIIYTKNVDGNIIVSDTEEIMTDVLIEHLGFDMNSMIQMRDMSPMSNTGMSSMMINSTKMWQEMLSGKDGELINPLLEKQYEMVYGSWPSAYNEIVLILDKNNELSDISLYALGLKSKAEVDEIMEASINQKEIEKKNESWSYEEICDMEFCAILNSDCYSFDEKTGTYTDLRDTEAGLRYLYDNGIRLKVSGIIRPDEKAASAMLTGQIGYTKLLTKHIIEQSRESDVIRAQLTSPDTDIFTGLPFNENSENLSDEEKEEVFKSYIKELSTDKKAETYIKIASIPSEEQLNASIEQTMSQMKRADIEQAITQSFTQQTGKSEAEISGYISTMSDEDLEKLFISALTEQIKAQTAAQVKQQLAAMTPEQLSAALDAEMENYSAKQCAVYYDEILEFSDSSYENNLTKLGYIDLNSPSTINIFASSFENKDIIEDAITEYNDSVDELSEIRYTDYIGIMMSSVTKIINAITYVLIAFVAISLIVSSIMIGVITLISVQERTKEIGILRAIGASKKNVSSMFNAETMIIGFTSGLLGIAVTYLLCIPINAIIYKLTSIEGLRASLPVPVAVILILISMLLTIIAGIIPSRSAAKKDPVVALRTE